MVLMDLVPVLVFMSGVIVLAERFGSVLFMIGAVLIAASGLMKVMWKLVMALSCTDVRFLNRQLHFIMPGGFALCVISLITDRAGWSPEAVCRHIFSMPALIFLILMIVLMILMFYMGKHNDTHDAQANWIEQGINILMQMSFLLLVVL